MTTAISLGRLSLVEYEASSWMLSDVAVVVGASAETLTGRIKAAEQRIQKSLNNRKARLELHGGGVRPEGFAGLLRIDGGIELEVAPKFLGNDAKTWREDFFYIATLSHFGRVLPPEALQATRGERGDLATIAARALVELYWENHRRPLRTYRASVVHEYSVDGDVEAWDMLFPADEGFRSRRYSLTRQNTYNAALKQAARLLMSEVRDVDTRKQLERLAHQLGHQSPGRDVGRQRVLPGRARGWQSAHDLACDVIGGFGLRFGERDTRAPGFLVDTWRAWQDLVSLSLRIGLADASPVSQRAFRLGERLFMGGAKAANVIPDVVLDKLPMVVVDAKYKGRLEDGREAVSETDLYETLAFLEATGAPTAVLIYPMIPRNEEAGAPGTCGEFERATVRSRTVIAIEVEVRGISNEHGLAMFASNIAAWFRAASLA